MGYDLVLKNASVVSNNEVTKLDIGVSEGKIACLSKTINEISKETIDASGLHVLPGVSDAHVHFDEPGRTDWETIKQGSSAFAAGGGAVYFDMPLNSYPTTCDMETFNAKLAIAQRDSYTDFGIWGGLTPYSLDKLESLAEAGVIGFKAFSCFTGVGGIDRADDYTLFTGMKKLAKLNLPLMVHSENAEITRDLTNLFLAEGKLSAKDYFASRPVITEVENVSRMIHFAEETGCRVFIAHVSTEKATSLVTQARARGVDIHCETIGHYLAFNEDDVERIGTNAKCSPPIRDKANQVKMWAKLLLDEIAFVSSDHSPCEPHLKEGEFLKAWGGITACQSTLPLLLTYGYHDRKLDLEKIAKLTSENMNSLFNIPNKGKIEVGYDADFAVVDLNKAFTLKEEDLLYKHKISLYVDYLFKASVVQTILRGKTVFKDGKIVSEPFGRHVKPNRK